MLLEQTHVEYLMVLARTHVTGPTEHHPTSLCTGYIGTVVVEPAEAKPKVNPVYVFRTVVMEPAEISSKSNPVSKSMCAL